MVRGTWGSVAAHRGIDRRRIARPDDRGFRLDPAELPLVFQLGLGRTGSGAGRLIDSNLDWGQDLVELQRWWRDNIPDEPTGLAYFGQFNPSIFELRGEPFRWFLPPGMPGTVDRMPGVTSPRLIGPARKLTPGYYAVSATLLYGLRWRLYDPAPLDTVPEAIQPTWSYEINALKYFRQFRPIMPPIGIDLCVSSHRGGRRPGQPDVRGVGRRIRARSHRLATDIDLGEVIVARGPEQDVDVEPRPTQQIGQIGPELGEDRIAPVAAGWAIRGARSSTLPSGRTTRGGTSAASPARRAP